MADRPLTAPLAADLPENWSDGQIVAPQGADAGLSEQHGYNYLMAAVNSARRAINTINAGFDAIAGSDAIGVASFKGRTGAVVPQAGDYTAAQVGARPNTWTPTAAQVGAVPTTRRVNGKALSSDISLSASDVGARPSTWTPITYGTADLIAGSSSLDTGTVYLVYK